MQVGSRRNLRARDTMTKDQFCGAPANGFGYRHSGYQHYAEIENKVDNKRAFEYQLGDDVSELEESSIRRKIFTVIGASHTTLAIGRYGRRDDRR